MTISCLQNEKGFTNSVCGQHIGLEVRIFSDQALSHLGLGVFLSEAVCQHNSGGIVL